MEYYKPETAGEAVSLKNNDSMYIAGGTDLGVLLSDFIVKPDALIDLTGIAGLSGISASAVNFLVGACTTIADIAAADNLPPALVQGAAAIGSPQIRNMATIGGNICNASPCGDTLTPLVVLDAVFVIEGSGGERRIAAADFFTGPKRTCMKFDEILKTVIIPASASGLKSGFRMIGKRNGQAISQVNMAAAAVIEGGIINEIKIAAGSVAPIPLRLKKTEAAAAGKKLDDELICKLKMTAEAEIAPISDVRAGEDYRRRVTGALLEDVLRQLQQEDN